MNRSDVRLIARLGFLLFLIWGIILFHDNPAKAVAYDCVTDCNDAKDTCANGVQTDYYICISNAVNTVNSCTTNAWYDYVSCSHPSNSIPPGICEAEYDWKVEMCDWMYDIEVSSCGSSFTLGQAGCDAAYSNCISFCP